MRHLLVILLAAGCGHVISDAGGDPNDPGDPGDPGNPPGAGRCDPSAPFGTPAPVASLGGAFALSLTGDELVAITSDGSTMQAAARGDLALAFPAPTADLLATVNGESTSGGQAPSTNAEGVDLYFARDGIAFHTARADPASAFDASSAIVVDDQNVVTSQVAISSNSSSLYWIDPSDARLHFAFTVAPTVFQGNEVASEMTVTMFAVSADELALYYADGTGEVLVSHRTATGTPFPPGAPVAEVNTDGTEQPLFVTRDDCVLYLASDRAGNLTDVWEAHRSQ